jgi:hypothetical protein
MFVRLVILLLLSSLVTHICLNVRWDHTCFRWWECEDCWRMTSVILITSLWSSSISYIFSSITVLIGSIGYTYIYVYYRLVGKVARCRQENVDSIMSTDLCRKVNGRHMIMSTWRNVDSGKRRKNKMSTWRKSTYKNVERIKCRHGEMSTNKNVDDE